MVVFPRKTERGSTLWHAWTAIKVAVLLDRGWTCADGLLDVSAPMSRRVLDA
jgi:hypothetical protein